MEGLLALPAYKNSECVRWYNQTSSITRTQQNFRTKCEECQPFQNSILGRVQNFGKHGRVGNEQPSGRPASLSVQKQRVSNYFIRYSKGSLQRPEPGLDNTWSPVYNRLQNRLHMLPYRLQAVQPLEDRYYMARIQIAKWYLQNILTDALFLNLVSHSDVGAFNVDGNVSKHNVRT